MLSTKLRQLLRKYGVAFLEAPLQKAVRQPWEQVRDDAWFRRTVCQAAWEAAPMQLRLLDREALGWDAFLFAVRDKVYEPHGTAAVLSLDWDELILHLIEQPEATAYAEPAVGASGHAAGGAPGAGAMTTTELEVVQEPGAGQAESDGAGQTGATPAAATMAGAASAAAERSTSDDVAPKRASGAGTAVGIDLGTTYSVVAYIDYQGRPVSVPNAAGEILTPSVVLFDVDGPIVGKEAVLAAALEPDRVAECVKRDMGQKYYRRPVAGERLPPEVISSLILRKLRADAEKKVGPIRHAVITVPAYFDEPRRRATMDAGRLAGLDVLDILNEPTAAAICYGYQEGFLDREGKIKGDGTVRVLVYDLGGGTFDVTIVEMAGQSFKAIATDGDVQLGGKDWDEKLAEIVARRFQEQHGKDPRSNPETRQEMTLAVENAKKSLSERSKALVVFSHEGTRFRCEVTRQEFEEATAPLLLRTRTTTEIVVLQAGLTWGDIDKVLLVGGSTRMPQVVRMLRELTGMEPDHSVSADEAVAHGAALYADLLMQQSGQGRGQTQFSITNVNSHSLGVVAFEKKTGRRVNAVMIKKNTPLPHAATRRFQTAKPNQGNVRICILEGESELPDACTEVGVCIIKDLPPNLPAGWPIEVRFHYCENGRLQVEGKLVGHDATVTTEFIRDNSLSDDDLMLWAECLEANALRSEV